MQGAQIMLLLVSTDFLASDDRSDVELQAVIRACALAQSSRDV
jgi:hypothetical protein